MYTLCDGEGGEIMDYFVFHVCMSTDASVALEDARDSLRPSPKALRVLHPTTSQVSVEDVASSNMFMSARLATLSTDFLKDLFMLPPAMVRGVLFDLQPHEVDYLHCKAALSFVPLLLDADPKNISQLHQVSHDVAKVLDGTSVARFRRLPTSATRKSPKPSSAILRFFRLCSSRFSMQK